MKRPICNLCVALAILFFSACQQDGDSEGAIDVGDFEIEFDNIALIDDVARQLKLAGIGDTTYQYTNGMEQPFNITLLRYFISEIILEGPNGEYFADKMNADVSGSEGYYIIDEAKPESQLITLKNVPAGKYDRVTFTVGVDEEGIIEGAAGGALDPATNNMFWNWNAGYVTLKFEGQSPVSAGGANGEGIMPEHETGLVYHIGGWKDIEGQPFVYNNKELSFNFGVGVTAGEGFLPHLHMFFDAMSLFKAANMIDFTGNNNVHKPSDGSPMAENMAKSFWIDHLHQ